MKCWIMKAGRQVRDSNVRLCSYGTALQGNGTSRSIVTKRHCKAMELAIPLLRNGTARQWNQPFHCYETALRGNGTSRSIVTKRHCKAMEPAVPLLRNGTARQWNQPFHCYETALQGNGTSRCTMPVDIFSAHQTQTRNVQTVRHDQRLHGPHPQHIQSLAMPRLTPFRRWYHSA